MKQAPAEPVPDPADAREMTRGKFMRALGIGGGALLGAGMLAKLTSGAAPSAPTVTQLTDAGGQYPSATIGTLIRPIITQDDALAARAAGAGTDGEWVAVDDADGKMSLQTKRNGAWHGVELGAAGTVHQTTGRSLIWLADDAAFPLTQAGLVAALAAAAAGDTLTVRGTVALTLSDSLTVPSGVTLDLRGATFPRSDATYLATFAATGSLAASDYLTADANPHDTSVSITNTSGYSVGDVVDITDTGLGTTSLYGDATTRVRRHQSRVAAIPSSTSLTLEDPLDDTFLTSATARVERYTPVSNVTVLGGTTTGGAHFVSNYAENVHVESAAATGWAGAPGVAIYRTLGYTIKDLRFQDPSSAGSGEGYGAAVYASSHGHAENIRGRKCRHVLLYGISSAHGTFHGIHGRYSSINTIDFHGSNAHDIAGSDVTCVESQQNTVSVANTLAPDHDISARGIISRYPASHCYSDTATNYGLTIQGRCYGARSTSNAAWNPIAIKSAYDVVAEACLGRGVQITQTTNSKIKALIINHQSTTRAAFELNATGTLDALDADVTVLGTTAGRGFQLQGTASFSITNLHARVTLADVAGIGVSLDSYVSRAFFDITAAEGATTDLNAGATGISNVHARLRTRGRLAGNAVSINAAADVDYEVDE